MVGKKFRESGKIKQEIWEKQTSHHPKGLVDFNGKGKYIEPKFIWNSTIGPTALLFLNSTELGKNYENDMFVADVHNGTIYHFDLTKNRNGLLLHGLLEDKIANNDKEFEDITFAKGFDGGISDLAVGPDGCLYVLLEFGELLEKYIKLVPRRKLFSVRRNKI